MLKRWWLNCILLHVASVCDQAFCYYSPVRSVQSFWFDVCVDLHAVTDSSAMLSGFSRSAECKPGSNFIQRRFCMPCHCSCRTRLILVILQILATSELRRRLAQDNRVFVTATDPGYIITNVVRSTPGWIQYLFPILLAQVLMTPKQGSDSAYTYTCMLYTCMHICM